MPDPVQIVDNLARREAEDTFLPTDLNARM
jgi:hypothetical protein